MRPRSRQVRRATAARSVATRQGSLGVRGCCHGHSGQRAARGVLRRDSGGRSREPAGPGQRHRRLGGDRLHDPGSSRDRAAPATPRPAASTACRDPRLARGGDRSRTAARRRRAVLPGLGRGLDQRVRRAGGLDRSGQPLAGSERGPAPADHPARSGDRLGALVGAGAAAGSLVAPGALHNAMLAVGVAAGATVFLAVPAWWALMGRWLDRPIDSRRGRRCDCAKPWHEREWPRDWSAR